MDLTTIKIKVKNNKYHNMHDFYSDLNLIWNKCKRYNEYDSQIVKTCKYFTICF